MRIWCWRPVSSRHSTSVAPASAVSGRTCVTARFASAGMSPFGAPKVPVRAAKAVSAIEEQVRFHARRRHRAVRNGVIDAFRIVRAELRRQRALRRCRPGKHHEAARFLVQAMDYAELGVDTVAHAAQQRSSMVGERVPVPRLVGHAQHSGRLVDDDDAAVGKHDRALGKRSGAKLRRLLIDDDRGTRRNTRRGIEAALAIDGDAALGAQAARTRPRDARLLSNDGRDGGIERCHRNAVCSGAVTELATEPCARIATTRAPRRALPGNAARR